MVVGHSNFFCKIEDTSINKSTEGQNEETTTGQSSSTGERMMKIIKRQHKIKKGIMASSLITPIPFHIFINDLASSHFYHMIHELTARLQRTDLQQNCRLTTYIAHVLCYIQQINKGLRSRHRRLIKI
jgi:hypothetical protein